MSDSIQPETDDIELMAQVKDENEAAFCTLVSRHQQPVLNYFARMGASTAGEDLAQETFIRLWSYRKKYKPSAKFTTFLYTLARHVWLDSVRRQIRFRLFSDRYREEVPAFTDGGIGAVRKQIDIQAAIDQLTPKLREVLVLSVHQGLSYEEISVILSIPVGTVKSRVFNALATVQEMYDENK